MKKFITLTLTAMMLATSGAAFASPTREAARPQEYAPYPEATSACCCGGDVREERGNAPKQ